MGILEIVLIGVGLAMDAFAVSVCKGLSMRKLDWRKAIYNCSILWRISSNNACHRLFFRIYF